MADIHPIARRHVHDAVNLIRSFESEIDNRVDVNPMVLAGNMAHLVDDDSCLALGLHDGQPRRLIGILLARSGPCFFSGVMQSEEIVWFIRREHRGPHAEDMKNAFMEWSRRKGALRIIMGAWEDRAGKWYRRKGFEFLYTTWGIDACR